MKEAKYTLPGPWEAVYPADPFAPATVRDATGNVAETVLPDCARLIAAAPDLAAALQRIVRECGAMAASADDDDPGALSVVSRAARAALAKAGL